MIRAIALVLLVSVKVTYSFVSPLSQHTTLISSRQSSTITPISDADLLSDPMFIEPLTTPREGKKSPDELITIAKRFLKSSNGLGGDPDMLSESFTFEGPVVGPLKKERRVC